MVRILCETRTVEFRAYGVYPIDVGFADAVMVIQNGVPGPRGGMSKCSIRSYWIEEVTHDPTMPNFHGTARVFLVAKREGIESWIADLPPSPDECVYAVRVLPVMGVQCTCIGFRCQGVCKHSDALEDYVRLQERSHKCPYCDLPAPTPNGHSDCEEREQLEMEQLEMEQLATEGWGG